MAYMERLIYRCQLKSLFSKDKTRLGSYSHPQIDSVLSADFEYHIRSYRISNFYVSTVSSMYKK